MSAAAWYALYAVLAVGAAGMYLCLPTPRRDAATLRRSGAILAAAALVALCGFCARWIGPDDARVFFIIFAILAVVAAARVVTHPKPVYSALYFIMVVLSVTGLCVLAAAHFLAAALVIIYAGAILVTYVFVIMLAQQEGPATYDLRSNEPVAAILMGFAIAFAATQAMVHDERPAAAPGALPANAVAAQPDIPASSPEVSNVRQVGETLVTRFVLPVEVAGVLLLVAMVGSIAIARKRIDPADLTPEERRAMDREHDLHERGRQAAPF